jgi:hypothetical protein
MRSPSRAAAPLALLASLAFASGCGASDATTSTATTAQAAPRFAPPTVEKMIRRSIQPTLAQNLGEGARMKVTCKTTGTATLRCVTILVPPDASMERIKVVYGVTCTKRTCRWQPIG